VLDQIELNRHERAHHEGFGRYGIDRGTKWLCRDVSELVMDQSNCTEP
jgi:hypothetical protein